MFKFTIEAESIEMLATKMNHWAQLHAAENIEKKTQIITQAAVDNILDKVTELNENVQVATPVNNGDDLDVRGLPYDSRIHSAGKSKNQDGTWRYRRGIDETVIEQVEKEIKSIASPLQSAPIPPVPPSSPVIPEVPMAPPMMAVPVMPMLNPPDQTVTAPAPEVKRHPDAPAFASPTVDKIYDAYSNVDNGIVIPPGMKPAHTLQTFTNNLTEILAQLINEKKINKAYIESLCTHFNVKYIWNVIGSGNQIKELYEAFAQYGFITKLD